MPFAVRASLTRHAEREAAAGGQLALTLRTLTRSDHERLEFWGCDQVVDNFEVQRRYAEGDVQRVVIEAAQRDASLIPCFGFSVEEGRRPTDDAWLIDAAGGVVYPARRLRDPQGFLGVRLRATEASLWTPHQPHAVAERIADRVRVA